MLARCRGFVVAAAAYRGFRVARRSATIGREYIMLALQVFC